LNNPLKELVLATRNRDKIKEIRSILKQTGIKLRCADDFEHFPVVEEDGNSLEENAVKKASQVARSLGLFAIADDSGLEVDWLEGAPGIFSARFAGQGATYKQNNQKLLELLKGVPVEKRTARFRCVIALASPQDSVWTVEGRCEGFIAENPQGRQGFGYDPIFVVSSLGKTFAELSPAEKNKISHRAQALAELKKLLASLEN
jgi:XTP/dITP diphosphohydrolase